MFLGAGRISICPDRLRAQVSGGHSGGETPVPIPNTEVKPASADGTWGATPWESRSLPELISDEAPGHADGMVRGPCPCQALHRAARTAVRCSAESGLTASRSVTPEACPARESNHSKTIPGRFRAVSRKTQLRMSTQFGPTVLTGVGPT